MDDPLFVLGRIQGILDLTNTNVESECKGTIEKVKKLLKEYRKFSYPDKEKWQENDDDD